MSYIYRNSGQTKGSAWIAVAGLHGIALYALINGFGIEYIRETIANLPARNYETPPPPKDIPEPAQQQQAEQQFDVVKPVIPTIPDRGTFVINAPPTESSQPIAEPTAPYIVPPTQTPLFKPVGAMPKGSPGNWVTTNDYPTRDIRQGNEGTAIFLLAITADGKVSDCQITRSTGYAGLDQATCSKISQRARFDPARNESGQRVPGTYTGSITWVIPD